MKKDLVSLVALALSTVMLAGCSGSAASSASAASTSSEDTSAADSTGQDEQITYEKVTISLGSTGAAEDISTQSLQYMADYLSEKTDGAMTIELFPSSQLGDAFAMMEMVQQGSLDMELEGNYLSVYGVSDAKAGSILFLNKSKEMYRALNESDVKQDWYQQFEDINGIHILTGDFYRNATCYVSNVKIEGLSDFAGVKIRVPQSEITIKSLESTGASPTPISYSESLLSLQQGVVDAIWCTEDAAYTMGFYEVAKYLIELNTDQDSMYLYTNSSFYNGLGENERAALQEAADAAAAYYSGLADDQLAKTVQLMKDAGIEVITLSDEAIQEIWEHNLPVYEQMEADGQWSAGLLQKVLEATGQA